LDGDGGVVVDELSGEPDVQTSESAFYSTFLSSVFQMMTFTKYLFAHSKRFFFLPQLIRMVKLFASFEKIFFDSSASRHKWVFIFIFVSVFSLCLI
jgi:hypothetical protein